MNSNYVFEWIKQLVPDVIEPISAGPKAILSVAQFSQLIYSFWCYEKAATNHKVNITL